MTEHITTESLPGTEPVQPSTPAADGTVAGSDAETVVEVKDLLKDVLGKEYPTNEAAIKSLKDTYSYVGQMGQKVKTLETQLEEANKNQVTPDLVNTVKELQSQLNNANFYASHPEFNSPEVKALITDMGSNPEEVVAKDSFKKAFDALKVAAEKEQSQSVLHSSQRLGTVQDKMTQAAEANKAGNQVVAAENATMAVIEAYGLK